MIRPFYGVPFKVRTPGYTYYQSLIDPKSNRYIAVVIDESQRGIDLLGHKQPMTTDIVRKLMIHGTKLSCVVDWIYTSDLSEGEKFWFKYVEPKHQFPKLGFN